MDEFWIRHCIKPNDFIALGSMVNPIKKLFGYPNTNLVFLWVLDLTGQTQIHLSFHKKLKTKTNISPFKLTHVLVLGGGGGGGNKF
jgi:hypothetical protein